MVSHGQRLGEPLGLVVDAARPDRVDVTPVGLGLRVHLGIAVDLAGRGQEEPRPVGLGQLETAPGALAAHGQGLERKGQIVGGRGRAGQVEDAGDRPSTGMDADTSALDQGEARMPDQMGHVGSAAGGEIVDADDLVAPGQQLIAEMGSEETGPAQHHRARPLTTTDAGVLEADATELGRVEEVAGVDHHRCGHGGVHPGEVEPPELVPLGQHHGDGGTVTGGVDVGVGADHGRRVAPRRRPCRTTLRREPTSCRRGQGSSDRRPARRPRPPPAA